MFGLGVRFGGLRKSPTSQASFKLTGFGRQSQGWSDIGANQLNKPLLPGDGILHWSKSDHLNKAVPRESPHQGVSSHLSNGPKPLGQGLLTAHLLALIHRPNDQTNCRDWKGFDKLSDSVRAISMLNLLRNCIHTRRMTIAGVVIVSAAAVFHLHIGTSVTSSSYSPSQAVIAGV